MIAFLQVVLIVLCIWTSLGQNENSSLCTLCYCTNQTVDCSNREIININEEYWREILENHITEVNFSHDPITVMARVPYEVNITHYDLSYCNIDFIQDYSLINMMYLEFLNLSHNKLSANDVNIRAFLGRIKPELVMFTKLYELDLSYNFIHSLNQDVFSFMPNIRKLRLSRNPLVIIDQVTMGAITSLSKLKELELANCQLEKLPEGFLRRLILLEKLDLAGNWFLEIPSVLAEGKWLKVLNLSKNPIQEIEEGNSLSQLTQLQTLQLSNMEKLKIIQDYALGGLASLLDLNVSQNPRLSIISPLALYWREDDLENCPELTKLHLNNNNLTDIDSHFLKNWETLRYLNVGNNPFICDCKLRWTIQYIVPLLQKLGDKHNTHMICKKPEEYSGLTLSYLYEEKKELLCKHTHEDLTEDGVLQDRVVLGIMIGIFITLPLVTLLVVLWKKGVLKKLRSTLQGEYEAPEIEVPEMFLDNKLGKPMK